MSPRDMGHLYNEAVDEGRHYTLSLLYARIDQPKRIRQLDEDRSIVAPLVAQFAENIHRAPGACQISWLKTQSAYSD